MKYIPKYIPIILILFSFAVLGCLESSSYKQIPSSELISNLSIFTEKDVYHSNETLKAHIDFNSSVDGRGLITVSGVKNAFGRALINETREDNIKKGYNGFDFELKTPSCEECSALSPGVYALNATVTIDGRAFETYKKITLEREISNISNASAHNPQINTTETNNTQTDNSTNNNIQTGKQIQTGTHTSGAVTVEYFYIPGCQKCEKATPVVESVIKSYGDRVNFLKYNANEDGRDLAIQYQIPGTPAIIINKGRQISYENYNGDTVKLEALLKEAIDTASTQPSVPGISSNKSTVLSVPSVLGVGLLAGFNPCLLAILAFIASVTLATTGRRRNVLLIVLMFSFGIFVTYLIVGIGLLRIIEQSATLQTTIRSILVVLIGVLGIWHVYDAYHLKKNTESSFYTPKVFIRLTESVTKKVSLPAAFFIGALFSLIKAPCVGAVYFVILDMVRKGEGAGMLYLAAYNLGVVLPVLILGAAIAFGLNPEKVESFRKERRSAMRLVTGVMLIIIAVLMYAGII